MSICPTNDIISLLYYYYHKMNIYNDLTTEEIPKLIRRIAIPASIGFFFNTMYNVVDTYFAGYVSDQALAALSLSFPIFFIIIAMGSGVSTGATALISNELGAGNKEEARNYALQAISFSFVLSIILTILGISIAPWLFSILGAQGTYLDLALSYINIIFYGAVFFLLNHVVNSILNAQGDTKTFRNVLIIGFGLNLIFDPWFMFGGLGLPAMGLSGVAWATVFIQAISLAFISWRVSKTGIFCKDCWNMLIPQKKYIKDISKQGFPASLNMMSVAIGIFIITYFVSKFGESAVASYGIATRIDQIALMPGIGLNIAALTLIGQNNGAKKFDRCKEIMKKSFYYGSLVSSFGAIMVYFFAQNLMQFFTTDETIIYQGVIYLKISILIYFAYIFLFISTSILQGLKKPIYALWIGLYRQIIAPLIFFYLFVNILDWGIHGIWWGIYVVTWSGAIITLFYLLYITKKTFDRDIE